MRLDKVGLALWLGGCLLWAPGCDRGAGAVPGEAPSAPSESARATPGSAPTTTSAAAPATAAPASETPRVAVGAPAPDFSAEAHDGTTVSLAALRGRAVVIYFYPRDETPGCTAEAQGFRDVLADLMAAGATVVGVSSDSLESHRQFAANHGLAYPLLADTDGRLAGLFGVSTTLGMTSRTTFLVGRDGRLAQIWPKVKVDGHVQEVLAAVRALPPPAL